MHDLTLTQPPRHRGPRIALERFQAERDLAPGLVDAKHFHGHLLADAEPIARALHARVRELRHRHEPLHATEIHECAEIRERHDPARQHRIGHELLARLLGGLGRLLFEQRAARQHNVAAALGEPRDPEGEHAAHVVLLGLHASQLHLREGTERAQPTDGDLVTALDHAGHAALDGHSRLRRHRQRLARVPALPEAMRQTDLVARRDHRRFDLVADLDLEVALVVRQLRTVDPRLALAADVDEHVLVADLDDAALHDLTTLDGVPGLVFREERGEIFLGLGVAHGVTASRIAGRIAARQNAMRRL